MEFRYNPNLPTMSDVDGDSEELGILEIYVHHARNIHNICIYDNQDVYAKFSLTYNPDETYSTRIINGGGKNPEFNEKLSIKIDQIDAVLKCEIWMLSRARSYLEDQLLGFALVPISEIIGKEKITQDYSLSSTDLFHSPAGIVKLSLSLNKSLSVKSSLSISSTTPSSSSISAEVVLLDRKISQVLLDPIEYSRIEFPDINVVSENQRMVSEYFDGLGSKSCSFLHLGSASNFVDYEMTANSDENHVGLGSPNGSSSVRNSGFLSCTTTSLSDDRISTNSIDKKKSHSLNSMTTETNLGSNICPDTPTSKKESEVSGEKDRNNPSYSSKKEESKQEVSMSPVKFSPVFSSPLGNINLEAEQSAMQQQIVDMYMRSMQQFTESLAKMKLPMDLDKPETDQDRDRVDVIQSHNGKLESEKQKKDGSRVFYGSRAFF